MAQSLEAPHNGVRAASVDALPGAEHSPAEAYYLAEMARIPTLSHERQIELAAQVYAGRKAEKRLADEAMDPATRAELTERVTEAAEARTQLFEANLRLAVFIARQYRNRGLPLADLIQEANLGLLAAIDRFDHTKGFHFSTYAYWWIRQAVTRALADRGRLIRLPVHVGELLRRIERAAIPAEPDQAPPDVAQIAEAVGSYPERVREVMQAAALPLPLEVQVGDQGEQTLGSSIADPDAEDLADEVAERFASRALYQALAAMPQRDQYVLMRRFGLDGSKPAKFSQIARELNLSRERVRQLESSALACLRRVGALDAFREGA